jgi:hypothetical protein
MRILGQLFACLLVIVVGTALGTVPIIKDNMHWNFFFVIPISGFAIGMAFGWVQFQISRASRARVGGLAAVVMALACAAGYLGSDFGQYATMVVAAAPELDPEPEALSGIEAEIAKLAALDAAEDFTPEDESVLPNGLEDEADEEALVALEGDPVPLSEVMTFEEFMRMRLESSSIDMRPGSSQEATLEIGVTAATISFGADLLGTWLGSLLVLVYGADRNPYCRRCKRYKGSSTRREIPLEQEVANETVDRLQEVVASGCYEGVVSLLDEVAKTQRPPETVIKVATDERVCPGCHEATLVCRVMTANGADWDEALDVRVSSGTSRGASSAPIG